jgi:uncharacterized membrane protein YgdD (TMEM256/DUF423 family)
MPSSSLQKPLVRVAFAALLLLLVPAIAMQFTSEVAWGAGDFLAAGVLLFGAGTLAVLAVRQVRSRGHRVAIVLAVALGLSLVWAELAVGLFD